MSNHGTQLIIAEGTTGCGKSSVAQLLSIAFEQTDRKCCWYYERESSNPVRDSYSPKSHGTPEQYGRATVANWEAFISSLNKTNGIHCLDGCLFQSTICGLLLHDTGRQSILDLGHAVLDRLKSVPTTIIYLRSDDLSETIDAAYRERYPSLLAEWIQRTDSSPYCDHRNLSGMDGLVSFWHELRSISRELLASFSGQTVTMNVSKGDWSERYKMLLRHFSLPDPVSAPAKGGLHRFAGTYSRQKDTGQTTFSVKCINDELVVEGLAPFLWDSGNRLIPKDGYTFYAASWPTEVVFGTSACGEIASIRLVCRDQGWRKTDEVFPRVHALA